MNKMTEQALREWLELAIKFHGHKCPAMPLGLRSGFAAMERLGVKRAANKELFCILETGPSHAMMCYGDGVQVATGCTFGKGNIERLDYAKIAATIIDVSTRRAVRVSLKPQFQERALHSEFVRLREEGVEPQDIPAEVTDPLVEAVIRTPEDQLFNISEVFDSDLMPTPGTFEWFACEGCGEIVFAPGLRLHEGKRLCRNCTERHAVKL